MSGIPRTPSAVPSGRPRNRNLQWGAFFGALAIFQVAGAGAQSLQQRQRASVEQDRQKDRTGQAEPAFDESSFRKYDHALRDLEARINVIQALVATRTAPMDFMRDVRQIVNRTGEVGVSRVTPRQNRVELHGRARSRESISKFLASLQRSRKFSDVQLRRFYEDHDQNQTSYRFDLDGVYSPSLASAPAGESEVPSTSNAPDKSQAPEVENDRREWFRKLSREECSNRMVQLGKQISTLRTIVPDEPTTEQFLKTIHDAGKAAGVRIRTPDPPQQVPRRDYVELQFTAQVDGTYSSISNYFDRLAHFDRIISVSGLSLDLLGKHAVRKYGIFPDDAVSATCTVSTYFNKPLRQ